MEENKREIRVAITLDVIEELLRSMYFYTEVDGVKVTIYSPEIYRIIERDEVDKLNEWRKLIEGLSKLLKEKE